MRHQSNPTGLHPHQYKPRASTLSNNITADKSVKAVQSMYEFTKSIPTGEDGTVESVGQTLESYISMLDNNDREQTLSNNCAPGVEEGANMNPSDINQGQIHIEEGDDIECNEPVHKQPKIDPDCFPWVIADKASGTGL